MSDTVRMLATDSFGFDRGMCNVLVHDPSSCAGRHCGIHNPTPGHMTTWQPRWRADTGVLERLCAHGVGHPDPDDTAYKKSQRNYRAHHACDGCCIPPEERDDASDLTGDEPEVDGSQK